MIADCCVAGSKRSQRTKLAAPRKGRGVLRTSYLLLSHLHAALLRDVHDDQPILADIERLRIEK